MTTRAPTGATKHDPEIAVSAVDLTADLARPNRRG